MLQHLPRQTQRVVVAGGGVGALEAVMALEALAPQLETTLLTRASEYVVRPMVVSEPFVDTPARRYTLEALVPPGARHVQEDLESVNAIGKTATTDAGTTLPYDALVVACGGRASVRYPYAITVDDRRLDALMQGTLRDIEARDIRSVAFVAPERMAWPLPLYELALLTRERAWAVGADVDVVIVTPEDRPLEIFGAAASEGVSELLADAGIEVHTSVSAEVPRRREIVGNPGKRRVRIDRVIALPEIHGPGVAGLPADEYGFLPVDRFCRVRGAGQVFAAGDAAHLPVKHGGLAAQMAVTAARLIASDAGLDVVPQPFQPDLCGMLMTGRRPRYLRARSVGTHAEESRFSEFPLWDAPSKISSTYLEPRLQEIDARQPGAAGDVR